MSSLLLADTPILRLVRPDAAITADGQRAGPSGQGLFEAAAELLAAAGSLAANAGAPDVSPSLGPALACVEGSLEGLVEAAERLAEESSVDWPRERAGRSPAAGSFDRLADALRSAARACGDAARATAAGI